MSAVELEVGKADFDFYAKFAKPLILSLINTEDRILASAWFSKLRDETSGPEKLRLDYLKLLLFVLQRHRLAGPFVENPNIEETLESLGDNYDLSSIARQIIEKEQQEKKETYLKKMRGEIGDFSPFSTDFSPDLKEYVAAQDIPNFGVHVYYAISRDPILDWENAHHAVFPKAVKRMEPQGHLSETSFAVIEPKDDGEDIDKCKILEETGVMPDESIFLGQRRERERKSPYIYMDRPAPALGILPGEGEAEVIEEELPPPTWGSNLIEVREPIDMERPDTPADQSEQGAAVRAATPTTDVAEKEADPEDQEIVELLETSFNMEDILAEVDAIETEDFVPADEPLPEEDDEFAAAEINFQGIQSLLDQQDAAIAAAMAQLDEEELQMLADMEAADKAEAEQPKKPEPKQEVKVVADDETVIKVLVEEPGGKKESTEEKERKAAKKVEDKKKKPPGRTGLNKGKAKGAILKESEKKALEKEDKGAKVVATKTGKPAGPPAKRPGVPKTKPSTSKTKVVETASTGKIPTAKPSDSSIPKPGARRPPGSGIPTPGVPKPSGIPTTSGIPTPGGRGIARPADASRIPRPGETRIPRPGETRIPGPGGAPPQQSHMEVMKSRLQQMMQETREAFPEEFTDEAPGGAATPAAQRAPPERARRVRLSPIHEVSMTSPKTPGSPESDDIYDETDREFLILERLFELYEEIAPDVPDTARTPPLLSKHPEIRTLGRKLMAFKAPEFNVPPTEEFLDGTEEFQDATQFFAREGEVSPRPYINPRAERQGEDVLVHVDVQLKPESPPCADIEQLKKIIERAEKRVDISPAITGGVGVTTPKSPATPKRPGRRDLRLEFDLESPPPYESPPVTPEPLTTPEFVRIQRFGLPSIITEDEVERMTSHRYPEYEQYLQSEIQAERERWGRFAPGASPEPAPPAEPIPSPPGVPSPVPGPSTRYTPPPASPPMVEQQITPELPPEYQYQYETPPRLAPTQMPEIPGSPVFEPFDPLQHEDIMFQVPPDLVEAEFDEFEQVFDSPKFELQDWIDPLQVMADEAEFDFGLDIPPELEPELVSFEEPPPTPPPPPSPMTVLKQQLREHEIEPEFFDRDRPHQLSKRVQISSRSVKIPRKSRPTKLAKETIEEDYSGEIFEHDEEMIEQEVAKEEMTRQQELARQEEQKFMELVIDESERVEHLTQMIESAEAGEMQIIEEGPLEEMTEPSPPPSPLRTPIRTPERPVKPVTTPPLPPSREQLMFHGTPERFDDRPLFEEEMEFLASPGLPTPPPRSPSPPPSPEVPSPPPRGLLMWESPPMGGGLIFDEDIDETMLASPGMPKGRTLEDDFREIGSPDKFPQSFWQQSPTHPAPRVVSPQRPAVMAPRMPPTPPMPPMAPMSPQSPEIDLAGLHRELRAHEVEFRKARAGGFRAGRRWVGRRSARNYQLIPLDEHLDYEGSQKMPHGTKDYRILMQKLPPAPPPGPYPEELMDTQHEGRFFRPETLLDQPIPYEEELPAPIEPEWQLPGWRTPPRLRRTKETKPPPHPYARASHAADVLLFEEAPQGIYLPDEDVVPLELMGEDFVSPPRRPMPTSPPRPQVSPRMVQPPPAFALPSMTMSQQMMQAAHMAQWQAERIASPPKPVSPEKRPSPPRIQTPSPPRIQAPSPPRIQAPSPQRFQAPSPPRSQAPPPAQYRSPQQVRQPSPPVQHWSPEPGPSSMPHIFPYAPPSPSWFYSPPPQSPVRQEQQVRQPSPPVPHWSPEPGPSSMPHVYPYAPPSPPRQYLPPPQSPVRQPAARPSPQRAQVPSPMSPPRITKRVTEVKYTSQFYDPESPESSKKWTKGRTMLQFNRPVGDQRPVQSPPPQGVAVYGTGAPASAAGYSPEAPMPEMVTPERAPRRRPVRFMGRDPGAGETPVRRGGRLPRRRIFEGELDSQAQLHRRNLLSQFMDEDTQEPVPLSPPPPPPPTSRPAPATAPAPAVSTMTALQGERIEVMEEYEETEHDFIPERLRGFKWMDEPDDQYYSEFKKQF